MENFEEIYKNLISDSYDNLETKRKNINLLNCIFYTSIILSIIMVFILIFSRRISVPHNITVICINLLALFFITNIVLLIIIIFNNPKKDAFVSEYKTKIINKLITYVFGKSKYYPDTHIKDVDFNHCCFYEYYTDFYGNDYVGSYINVDNKNIGLNFSEIKAQKTSTDTDGNTTKYTVFNGIAGYILLKPVIENNIQIVRNNTTSRFVDKNIVKLDSSQFEEYFDVKCDDNLLAMQILTSDVMCELLNLINIINAPIEINIIKNEKVYFRLFTGEVFEPKIIKDVLDKKTLERYFNILLAIKHLTELIGKSLIEAGLGDEFDEQR